MDCVKCFSGNNVYAVLNACKNGHLECLKYMHENGFEWYSVAATYAALNGHLDCLKFIHQMGYVWDENTAIYAAQCPNSEILKYVLMNGCPHNQFVCYGAIEKGLMDNLKFAYEFGCEYDEVLCSYLLEWRYTASMNFDMNRVSSLKYKKGKNKYLEMIKYTREQGKGHYKFNCNQLGIHNTKKLKLSSKKQEKRKIIFDCCAYCRKINNVFLNENIIL